MSEPCTYDLFISYSTDPDAGLARDLEKFLESFHRLKTPKEIPLRALNVCRDGSDFSLPRLHTAGTAVKDGVSALITDYLHQSRQLMVLCSHRSSASPWVDVEVRWFLEQRGAENILLAVSEGTDPGTQPEEIFSPTILQAGLHRKPWYDFRAFKGSSSREWSKVRGLDDERIRLAADLNGTSAGEVQPIWYREQRKAKRRRRLAAGVAIAAVLIVATIALFQTRAARREQGLKLIADTYQLLYRDPSAAFLKAYSATRLLPGPESDAALKAAYKVAVLHHQNRREMAQMTGRGPGYLAGRWKQGDVFATASPNGRYQLVVTERGEDGATPPGEVYLVNNESLRTAKLEPCFDEEPRVEDASFDESSTTVFVSRYYEVNIYNLRGRCTGKLDMSCCTKSPVHLVRGLLANRYLIIAETKGGLWLADPTEPEQQNTRVTLQGEWHGDAAVLAKLSPDRRRAVIVFESGRAAIVSTNAGAPPTMQEIVKEGVLFATFDPKRDGQVVTSGEDGKIHHWDVTDKKIRETEGEQVAETAIDWVSFSDDGTQMLAVGANQYVYVVDRSGVLATVRETEGIDWASARTVALEPVRVRGERVESLSSVPRSDASIRRGRALEAGGRTWIVVEKPGEFPHTHITYVVDSGRAVTYPGLAIDTEGIEQRGEFSWLKVRGTRGGPLIRFIGNQAVFYPSTRIWVRSILEHDDGVYLATDRGLYLLRDTELTRITKETVEIGGLYPIGTRLWVATHSGGYVIEDGELRRVTEPFLDVRVVKEVGGRIWMLTRPSPAGLSGKPGPAYLVEGYLSRPLPTRNVGVVDVVEAGGRVWLEGSPGLYRLDRDQAVAVGAIPQEVSDIHEEHGMLRIKTQSHDNWPFTSAGPEYELNLATMQVRQREDSVATRQ